MIFGHGTDIIEVKRIEEKLLRQKGMKEKLYSEAEIVYCESKHNPMQSYAARFASKEAFFKALGTGWRGKCKWTEIEILPDELGKPHLNLKGKALEIVNSFNIIGLHVSQSHVEEYATSVVILETK